MKNRDVLNKDDPVAKKVLAYQESKKFKKELDALSEKVRLGLSPEEYNKYKKSNENGEKHEI